MKKLLTIFGETLFAAMLVFSVSSVQADTGFSEEELDQMVAPIALYPDSLLAQMLMATTYPSDVAEAVTWSAGNPDQDGDAAVQAVQEKPWDPSVMSLVAFPQVLKMMGEQPDWVQNIGDAFLADSDAVMDTVQKLRKKAKDEGNLETTEQQKVIVEQPSSSETVVIIEPADPKVVYVPVYNPTVVYGTWWWPRYTPWYYYPSGYYGFGSAVIRGIGFGIGVGITNSLWGGCRWGRGNNNVDININRYNNINRNRLDVSGNRTNWNHNSNNRRGVPYKDKATREKFSNKRDGAEQRKDFRGRDGDKARDAQRDKARQTMEKRGVDPAEGRKNLQGKGGDKARDSVNKANREAARDKAGNRDAAKKNLNRDQAKGAAKNRDASKKRDAAKSRDLSSKPKKTRDNALRGSGNAKQSRQQIDRGRSSHNSMRGGGGGGRGGGGGHGGGGGGGGGLRR